MPIKSSRYGNLIDLSPNGTSYLNAEGFKELDKAIMREAKKKNLTVNPKDDASSREWQTT